MDEVLLMDWMAKFTLILPELLRDWGKLALLGVPLLLFFAAVMIPFVVIFELIRAHFGRRSLFERTSKQLAGLGNILNWLFLGCASAGLVVAQPELATRQNLYLYAAYALVGFLCAATLLWSVVVAAWKPLRKKPSLHIILALLAGSCLAVIPAGGLGLGRIILGGGELPLEADWNWILSVIPSKKDPFWLLMALIHFFEAAAAGGVGLVWLLFRRHLDDFGRDYYAFAANCCGEWGAYGAWISFPFLAGLIWYESEGTLLYLSDPRIALCVAGLFLFILIPAILWSIIAKSATPMRHKAGMVLAVCFFVIGLAAGGVLLLA